MKKNGWGESFSGQKAPKVKAPNGDFKHYAENKSFDAIVIIN